MQFISVERQSAAQWWDVVENEHEELATCGKPANIEAKLMMVDGRLEALAASGKQTGAAVGPPHLPQALVKAPTRRRGRQRASAEKARGWVRSSAASRATMRAAPIRKKVSPKAMV